VRLLSNNPEKARQLEERGVTVTELVPLVVGVGEFNEGYLDAKRDRMGHTLPQHDVLDAEIQSAFDQTERTPQTERTAL
jgi:3,4-dihydroxy 2-butanone 4-phosphate synthase/GTP cyclohydrolase II